MKRFNKIFTMVMVVMVLVVLTGACQKADVDPDPIEQDDVQFVSVNSVIKARYDGYADVTTTFIFRVKTFAPSSIEGEAYVLTRTRSIGAGGINTGGQWSEVPIVVDTFPSFGTHDISGYVILKSTGKRVDIPTTQFTVQ
jgi:hypothetical protein